MNASTRVVVTGLGLISPLGDSGASLWQALQQGRSGVRPLTSLPTEHLPLKAAAEATHFSGAIDDFGPLEKQVERSIKKGSKVMCREISMGVAAAQLALHDAQLDAATRDPDRSGVVYGSDYIMTVPEEFADAVRRCLNEEHQFEFDRWAEEGLPKVDPLWLLKYLPNMPASHIAIYNDLRGPNNSITLREASANLAVGEAYCTIRRGQADAMVAGATGTRVHPLRTVHVALQEEVAQGDDPAALSRPFDLHRNGMVLGKGAGAVVLESLEFARRRGANILAEVVGQASSTVMDRDGSPRRQQAVQNVLAQGLRSAGLTPSQLGHLHAHGLSTRQADAEEAQGIAAALDGAATPVVAAKSYFGRLGAGSGLVELIASLLALGEGRLFPILNYQTPDPQCPIRAAREEDPAGDSFINLNFTPQGQASAVVLRRFVA